MYPPVESEGEGGIDNGMRVGVAQAHLHGYIQIFLYKKYLYVYMH